MRLLFTWPHSVDHNCVDPDQLASDDLALQFFSNNSMDFNILSGVDLI